MIAFASAISTSTMAGPAAREAMGRALQKLEGVRPVLAIAFASPSYEDLESVPDAIGKELGRLPIGGGTAGQAVFDQEGVPANGVLVVVIGGDGVCAATAGAPISSAELIDVVPAAAQLLKEADAAAGGGFHEALCLAFAPSGSVDGEAFAAALRKGTASRMQLAGALTGDDATSSRARVFSEVGAHSDRVQLMGVFTRQPVGIAARHGWSAVGPTRVVTRSDGPWLKSLDGRRAIDAWLADVCAADGRLPTEPGALLASLANGWELGVEVPSHPDPILRAPVRSPVALRGDGAVLLSGAITEGTRVRVMRASGREILRAAHHATALAHQRVGGKAAGALLFSCAARLAVLGERFAAEPAELASALGAPVAGTCVHGEIALAHKEVDAFHNGAAVVIAWPRD
jgi:hypothetical protein